MYDYKKMWTPSLFDASAKSEWIQTIRDNLIEGSVLDLACGTGRFVSAFENHDYLGVDIAVQAIEACKTNNPDLKFEVRDIVEWKTKRKFDNIFTWTALEHIPVEEIEQVAKKLKSMGKNIIMVEPTNFKTEITSYCHDHDYIKLFDAKVVDDFKSVKMFRRTK